MLAPIMNENLKNSSFQPLGFFSCETKKKTLPLNCTDTDRQRSEKWPHNITMEIERYVIKKSIHD